MMGISKVSSVAHGFGNDDMLESTIAARSASRDGGCYYALLVREANVR